MQLNEFQKKKNYLICVDSDGCAMDTMDIKHYHCFGPCLVEEWGLQEWETAILDRWNVINLYSMTRGVNRFKGLVMMLEEIDAAYTKIEDLASLQKWAENSKELSNTSLENAIAETGSPALKKALAWSKAVNKGINALPMEEKKPFAGVKEALREAHAVADIAIVSSANYQAVVEEWELHGLLDHVDLILTQDVGSKAFCIAELIKKGYATDKVLMVGDAPGDRAAAEKNGVFYYPILVRKEDRSWVGFRNEALDKLLEGTFAGAYQEKMLQMFGANLGAE